MLRKVLIPSIENSTITIPSEYYGKEVEILLFPSSDKKQTQYTESVNDIFAKYLYSFKNYKFDRDDANNYE